MNIKGLQYRVIMIVILLSACQTESTPDTLPTVMEFPTETATASRTATPSSTPTPDATATPVVITVEVVITATDNPRLYTPTSISRIPVVIAVQNIPAGTVITENRLGLMNMPADIVPAGAYDSTENVVGRIARVDIVAEMMILSRNLVDDPEQVSVNYIFAYIANRDFAQDETIGSDDVTMILITVDDLLALAPGAYQSENPSGWHTGTAETSIRQFEFLTSWNARRH